MSSNSINDSIKVQKPMIFSADGNTKAAETKKPTSLFENMPVYESSNTFLNEQTVTTKASELKNKLKDNLPPLSMEFLEEVVELSQRVSCNPEDLLALMYHESGGWNPSSVNRDKNGKILYGGLIQMNPASLRKVSQKYAKQLGLKENITMKEYLKLPREKQLKYAEGYLELMKDSCNLENKSPLTGGETWGMIKSPKRTKNREKAFFQRIENLLSKIKSKIFKPSSSAKHLDRKS